MRGLVFALISLLPLPRFASPLPLKKIAVGYYVNWAQYRSQIGQYPPENINARHFTHIHFAFAGISPKTLQMHPTERNDVLMYKRVQKHLRRENPGVKILLSIGVNPAAERYCSFLPKSGLSTKPFRIPSLFSNTISIPDEFSSLQEAARICTSFIGACTGITETPKAPKCINSNRRTCPSRSLTIPSALYFYLNAPGGYLVQEGIQQVTTYQKVCRNQTRMFAPGAMVESDISDAEAGKIAKNAIAYSYEHGFDGIEIHLNTPPPLPGSRTEKSNVGKKKGEKNALWVGKLVRAFGKEILVWKSKEKNNHRRQGFLLSAAVGAGTDAEIQMISNHGVFSYISLLAFDRAGCWEPGVRVHCPLYRDNARKNQWRHRMEDPRGVSIDETINRWHRYGVPSNKTVLVLPLFARTWTLEGGSKGNVQLGFTNGFCGLPGPITREAGMLSYYEAKLLSQMEGSSVFYDEGTDSILIITSQGQLVSFDGRQTLEKKVEYALSNGLSGVGLWSIDMDSQVRPISKMIAGKLNIV
ncbi:hypothetical protein AAMO2058_001698300 [Amorphochlora amoebiformis]